MASFSSSSSAASVFTVRRQSPVLIRPAADSPRELKLLSDVDDQETLRFHLPMIMFYPNSTNNNKRVRNNPAKVIADAIAKALVYYYPLAGRLVELGPGRKLAVDCTGEGVLFIEAEADIRLEQFRDVPMPPVPCVDELAFDVPGSSRIIGCPLLLFQVTRLACGGFVFAVRFNHTLCDGPGLVQFLNAVGEIARGAAFPSVLPVWARHLLISEQQPPPDTFVHPEYIADNHSSLTPNNKVDGDNGMSVQRSFFFGDREISALRSKLSPEILRRSSTFDILAAAVWRSRTIALGFHPEERVRILNVLTAYTKLNSWIPAGFYGNAFVFTSMDTIAGKLSDEPLSYALELILKAKFPVTREYMQSLSAMLDARGRPAVAMVGEYNTYVAADVTRAKFHDADFGWGKAIFGAPGTCGTDCLPAKVLSYYVRFKNREGEDRIVVPVKLPEKAMERFIQEMEKITSKHSGSGKPLILSTL